MHKLKLSCGGVGEVLSLNMVVLYMNKTILVILRMLTQNRYFTYLILVLGHLKKVHIFP